MKKLVVCLVLGFAWALAACAPPAAVAVTLPGPVWKTVGPPYAEQWRDLGFGDELHGYAIAHDCGYATDDGGHTWTQQAGRGGLCDLDFVSATRAWAVGDAGAILTTADAGQTWQAQVSGTGSDLRFVDFVDADYGWASTSAGVVLATTDGGATWGVAGTCPSGSSMKLAFADHTHGWAVSGNGLWSSSDGGATWTQQSLAPPPVDLTFVRFFDAQHGWAGGYDGLWSTTDGGATWVRCAAFERNISDVATSGDLQHLWAVDTGGEPFFSADGGQTWRQQTVDDTYLMAGDMRIVVVGDHGWLTAGVIGYDSGWGIVHTDCSGYSDGALPVTQIGPELTGWQTSPVTMTLSPTDVGSGVDTTYYRVDCNGAGGEWHTGTGFTVPLEGAQGADGTYTVSRFSTDVYGNAESEQQTTIQVDQHPPITTLVPGGRQQMDCWTNKASTIAVRAGDGAGSGVATTLVDRGRGELSWDRTQAIVTKAPTDHSNDGVHSIKVHSTDLVGHSETVKQHAVAIDTRLPVASAPYGASCPYKGYATVKFKIVDRQPCYAKGMVQFRILTQKGRLAGIVTPQRWFAKNRLVSFRFQCPLRRGTYRLYVRVADGAGNISARQARTTLTVR